MREDSKVELFKDPHLPWNGTFPYDRLRRVGIRPRSTAREVNDALFDLMAAGGASHEDRAAWDELHYVERRLSTDFFLYCLPAAEMGAIDVQAAERPMPVGAPDFRRLACLPVDFAAVFPEGSPFDVWEYGSARAWEESDGASARPHAHTPPPPHLPPVPPLDIGSLPFHRPRCLEGNHGQK